MFTFVSYFKSADQPDTIATSLQFHRNYTNNFITINRLLFNEYAHIRLIQPYT